MYVLLAFFFVFFLFCWRRGVPSNQLQTKVPFTIKTFNLDDRKQPNQLKREDSLSGFVIVSSPWPTLPQEGGHCLLKTKTPPTVVTPPTPPPGSGFETILTNLANSDTIDDYWQQLLTILDKTSSPSRPQGVQLPNALGQSQETIFLKSLIIIRIKPGKVCPSKRIWSCKMCRVYLFWSGGQCRRVAFYQNNKYLFAIYVLELISWYCQAKWKGLFSAYNEIPNLGLGPNWDQAPKNVPKSPNFTCKSQISFQCVRRWIFTVEKDVFRLESEIHMRQVYILYTL